MIGYVATQWKVTNLQFGVISYLLIVIILEIDFDRTGEYMVSCGEDKNWMIWKITESSFENRGMITNLHSRSIYSCSWAKEPIPNSNDLMTDLIATVIKIF